MVNATRLSFSPEPKRAGQSIGQKRPCDEHVERLPEPLLALHREPLFEQAEALFGVVSDGLVMSGPFRGYSTEQLKVKAESGDGLAQLQYGIVQLRQLPTEWSSRSDDDSWRVAEGLIFQTAAQHRLDDLAYVMHELYRTAVATAWLNLDTVGEVRWRELQSRYLAYKQFIARHASPRQYMQVLVDDEANQQVINSSGLMMPIQAVDPLAVTRAAQELENTLPKPVYDKAAVRAVVQDWANQNAGALAESLGCISGT
ncbi:MAG: hypothetical protein ACK4E7_02565 [Permianibacter sp.]